MRHRERYTVEQVADALRYSKGMVTVAAQRLRCDPETVHNYCKRHAVVRQARDDARGELLDLAELKLWQAVQRGEAWAIAFTLKTIGRDRGYVERTEAKVEAAVMHGSIEEWERHLQRAHAALAERRQKAIEAQGASRSHADSTVAPELSEGTTLAPGPS